jgi:DNA-binding NtrC family response regulator
MLELIGVAARLATTDLPVLITGETGTGKEIVARLIHRLSTVADGPFVPFNCSALPRELVESQLFGHRKGAFTGAVDSFPGVIRAADRGTLFLDEIGDLDLTTQPKLLRFLESGEIRPVGDVAVRHVSCRIVAATNANLDFLTAEGRFRQDLYYRVGVASIALPPLRERKDEIPALARLFIERFAVDCGRQDIRLSDEFIAALLMYDWPGNIRQLANEIRRAVAMATDGQALRASDLAVGIAHAWTSRSADVEDPLEPTISVRLDQTLAAAVSELEQKFIGHALEATGGRVSDAARLLGLSRKGLFLKRRRQGLISDA